jgi:hypothetical protein
VRARERRLLVGDRADARRVRGDALGGKGGPQGCREVAPVIDDKKQQLVLWYRRTYRERTQTIEGGHEVNIDWILPETRIVWSEIMAKARDLGITDHVVDLRLWWNGPLGPHA